MVTKTQVAIVGGGLAGLCCAIELQRRGIDYHLYEAADRVGGRIKTDTVDGYLLDHGFQVLQKAYQEASQVLNYDTLDLHSFQPGSLIRCQNRFCGLYDAFRQPSLLVATVLSPAASLSDKLNILKLRWKLLRQAEDECWSQPETTTLEYLRQAGFQEKIIERFFRPFLSGIFLEKNLETSSRMFEFIFRIFSQDDAALPANGMEAIPRQLSTYLLPERLHCNKPVKQAGPKQLVCEDGEEVQAKAVVLAVDQANAAPLCGQPKPERQCSVICEYFATKKHKPKPAILYLNGTGQGLINNLCFPSEAAPSYAPHGQQLVSVSIVGQCNLSDAERIAALRRELTEWFGEEAQTWQHLRSYPIHHALPSQRHIPAEPPHPRLEEGLYACGDYRWYASINAAMLSGKQTAQAIIEDLR